MHFGKYTPNTLNNNMTINTTGAGGAIAMLAIAVSLAASASASVTTWVEPKAAPNSNANWPAVGGTDYTKNFGIAFQTGSSGTFSLDWLKLSLNSSGVTAGSATLKVELRNTTSTTAYSGVAGTTAYTTDTITLALPGTSSTAFDVTLTETGASNLMAYTLQPNTAYSLILYAPSQNIGMGRTTGYANGTTNDQYAVTNGFTVLDTFRNNSANYSNNASSFPTIGISFGATVAAAGVPEPAGAASAILLGSAGMTLVRRRKR